MSVVNFLLNSDRNKFNFDPENNVLTDSKVEDRLDNIFSAESLGIPS